MNMSKPIIISFALAVFLPSALYAQENIHNGQVNGTAIKQQTYNKTIPHGIQHQPLNSPIDSSFILKPKGFPSKPLNGYGSTNLDESCQDFILGKRVYWGAASQTDILPGLMTRQSLNMQLTYRYKNLSWASGVNVNKYLYDGVQTQYGVFSNLSLQLSNNLSVTLYGQYYSANPYYSMATFPYVNTSEYGAYLSIHDETKGLKLGARRKYDPYRRHWYTVPVVSPYIKIGKIGIELPLGDILQSKLFDDEPNILPIRMPAPAGRPLRPMRR